MNDGQLYLESNFTQLPNEILDALIRTHLKPNESKIIHLVMRKTYGWHKPDDWIALGQIAKYTGIIRCNVSRYVNSLTRRKILIKDKDKRIRFNENTSQWIYGVVSISTKGCYQY